MVDSDQEELDFLHEHCERLSEYEFSCLGKEKRLLNEKILLDEFERLIALYPDRPILYHKLAAHHMLFSKDFTKAAEAYKKLISLKKTPESYRSAAYANLAFAYMQMGDYKNSKETFEVIFKCYFHKYSEEVKETYKKIYNEVVAKMGQG